MEREKNPANFEISLSDPKLLIASRFDYLIRKVEILEFRNSNANARVPGFKIIQTNKIRDVNEADYINTDSLEEIAKFFDQTISLHKFALKNDLFLESRIDFEKNLVTSSGSSSSSTTQTRELLVQERTEIVKQLRQARDEALARYDTIRDEYEAVKSSYQYDVSLQAYEKLADHLFSLTLANKYYFLLINDQHPPFKIHLVILDFYLNNTERNLLKYFLDYQFGMRYFSLVISESRTNFRPKITIKKEYLLIDLLRKYLHCLMFLRKPVSGIIRIERNELAKIETRCIQIFNAKSCDIDLDLQTSQQTPQEEKYNFSHLKNIEFYKTNSYFYDTDKYVCDPLMKFYPEVVDIQINVKNVNLLTSLESLSIGMDNEANNSRCTLSRGLFSSNHHFSNLYRLCLERCDLRELAYDALETLRSLQKLKLSYCTSCSHLDLYVLTQLDALELSYNDSLPSLRHLSQDLRVLVIRNLVGQSRSDLINYLQDLKHNTLTVLDITSHHRMLDNNWLLGFPNLKALKIDDFVIGSLPCRDAQMTSLQYLVLNRVSSVAFEEAERRRVFPNLKRLDLNSTCVKLKRPEVFTGFATSLIHLSIRSCELDAIHKEAFRGLDHLETLDLSGNKLKHLDPETFVSLPKLKHLDLSRNLFNVLDPGMFTHLNRLESLMLCSNRINGLQDEVFWCMHELETLDLSGNKIVVKMTSSTFKGLVKMKRLVLKNSVCNPEIPNLFDSIPPEAFLHTVSLREVEFGCVPVSLQMQTLLKEQYPRIKFSFL